MYLTSALIITAYLGIQGGILIHAYIRCKMHHGKHCIALTRSNDKPPAKAA